MPRAGLTRDRVVAEAELMADEVGLGRLTLAALAERLGVRQPSLYKHIDSLAGLHRSISLRAKRELGEVLSRAAVGRSGADAVYAMSYAYRDWAVEHPARYQASNVMPAPGDIEIEEVSRASIQVIADVLAAYDLEGDDAIDAIRAFRSSLHGFVSFETEGGFALSANIDRSFDRLVRGFIVALSQWTDAPAPRPAPAPAAAAAASAPAPAALAPGALAAAALAPGALAAAALAPGALAAAAAGNTGGGPGSATQAAGGAASVSSTTAPCA